MSLDWYNVRYWAWMKFNIQWEIRDKHKNFGVEEIEIFEDGYNQ